MQMIKLPLPGWHDRRATHERVQQLSFQPPDRALQAAGVPGDQPLQAQQPAVLTVQHMLHMQGCFTELGRVLLRQSYLLDLEAGPVLCEGTGIEYHQCRLHAGLESAGRLQPSP